MFTVAATTVALSAAAFSAENIRAGLESVHVNQWDAAEAMNMGGLSAHMRRVILPQAWRVIIPPSMTYAVGLVKNTSIASQIGVLELTYAAKILNQKGYSAAMCFGTILILYFILCYSLNSCSPHSWSAALPHLVIDKLSADYGTVPVLRDVSLSVERG